MSALSDAVAAVQASVDKVATDMNKAFTDLEAALAANPSGSTDVDAAVAALGAVNTKLQGLDASAIAADPPAAPAA